MKIEKIYIENFGKLSDYTLDLSDGLNLIFGNNEDGKTTIMSFIRLMFYGNCGKKSDICSNIRHRFRPLSNKEMGGRIDFTHNERSYSLIRNFGKTTRGDKIILLDRALGTQLPRGEGEPGEEFFSMGADAFERSIYIGSLPIMGDDGLSELSSKLATVVYTGDTGDSFEQIDERLSGAQTALRTPRRVGAADRTEREISDLSDRLRTAKAHEADRLAMQKSLEKLSADLEEKTALLSSAIAKEEVDALTRERENRKKYILLKEKCGDFTAEGALEAEKLLEKSRELSADLRGSEILEGPVSLQTESAEEALLSATERLEKINADMRKTAEELALARKDSQAAKNASPLPFIIFGILFLVLAICGAFITPWLYLSAAPAVCFILLSAHAAGKSKNAIKTENLILSLREKEIAQKSEQTALQTEVATYSERLRILRESAENREKQLAKIAKERDAKKTELENILSSLSQLLGTDDNHAEALREINTALSQLSAVKLILSQSPYKDLSDKEIDEKISISANDLNIGVSADALSREVSSLKAEIIRRESELKTGFSHFENPAVLEREIMEKTALLDKQNEHYERLSLAREILSKAYYEMRGNFAPELNALTAKYLSLITDGKYTATTISNEFSVLVNQGGAMPMESEYLSAGSRDQLDLCIRLSLARLTGGEHALPLMLDDIFIQYDAQRAATAFSLIADFASDRQVLFFTCHKHIEELAKQNGANLLKL